MDTKRLATTMKLSLEEKIELGHSKVFENLQNTLQKKLPKRKVKTHSTLNSTDFGSEKNIYVYVVTVVVNK